jgi:predicted NBD/HSP70 family sugar kinase
VEEKLAAARQKSDEMEEELKDMVEQLMNAENEVCQLGCTVPVDLREEGVFV